MHSKLAIVRGAARVFLVCLGLFLLALPLVIMNLRGDFVMIDDTRAWLGGGVSADADKSVPVVTGVHCTKRSQGSLRSSDRNIDLLNWECRLGLAPAGYWEQREAPPPSGESLQFGTEAYNRQLQQELDMVRARSRLGSITRLVPTDRSADDRAQMPELRRLSPGNEPAGEPPRYGVVWGAGEILLRWLAWLPINLLFLVLGGVLLYVAVKAGRRQA